MNFLAPALGVGVLTAIGARIFMQRGPAVRGLWLQALVNFAFGALLLFAGLLFFGHDGKMATYAALVVGVATSQLWLMRGGRR